MNLRMLVLDQKRYDASDDKQCRKDDCRQKNNSFNASARMVKRRLAAENGRQAGAARL